MPKLYLIPSPIADDGLNHIPPVALEVIQKLDHFCCERARTSRRYFKQLIPTYQFQNKTFAEIDKHSENVITEEIELLFE